MRARRNEFCLVAWAASLSIAGLSAAGAFRPAPPDRHPGHQKSGPAIIAAAAYLTDEDCRAPFGKLNPAKHGVLPVLLVIRNDGAQTLSLANLHVRYADSRRHRVEPVPAADVPYLRGPIRPPVVRSPIPGTNKRNKNPLAALEIESRAFAAKMLPPGETAHGFFYFQAPGEEGATLLVNGIEEARTRQELFYAEVPVDRPAPNP